MILRRALVAPLALLVAMVTASVTLYVGVADAPGAFFGDDDFVLLLPPGELIPGQGSIDASLARPLAAHASVERLSAEVYAPTIVQGRSVLVRGVDFASFLSIEPRARVDGRVPADASEALVGVDLARALDVTVGDYLVVPGSKSSALVELRIVGLLDAPGPARDEIVATLEGARALVDLRPDDVHVIRIDPADRAAVIALVRGVGATFSYSNVTLSTKEPLPGEIVTLTAELTNWGPQRASNVSTVRGDGAILATRTFDVGARATRTIEIPFRVPERGISNVTLNPTFEMRTRAPEMRFELDGPVAAGAPLAFRLAHADGSPAADVLVQAGANATRTDQEGAGAIVPPTDGVLQLRALVDDRAAAIVDVFVAQQGAADRALARVLGAGAQSSDGYVRANAPIALSVHVMNVGGVAGFIEVPVTVNGTIVAAAQTTLEPGADVVLSIQIPALAQGEHAIRIGPFSQRLIAIEGDPAIEAILVGYDAAARQAASDIGEAHADYVEQVTGNVRLAIVALSIATGALATTAALAVLARHMGERAPVLGVLKALGASDEAVQERAAREALAIGALASALGIGAGVLVAIAIEATDLLHAFGHQIHPRFPWHVLALIFLLASVFVSLATRRLVGALLRRAPDALLRGAARE